MGELSVFSALRVAVKRLPLTPVYGPGYGGDGWITVARGGEPFMGGFQQDAHVPVERVQSNWAWWSCATLIANDIGKMRIKLVERDTLGIWTETDVPAFSPVLRKPNNYQTRQQFIECWMHSKLGPQGNTYVFKERDRRQVVVALHVLDPIRCRPLVASNGQVYYRLGEDRQSRIPSSDEEIVVPASEIIHDRTNCLFHPLVGISSIYANGLAASQGLRIQEMSATFFMNNSRPSGILTAPGILTNEQALDHSRRWNENYGAGRQGKTAILGNGLTYSPIAQTAQESQLSEQLKMTAEMICSTFHVPAYKVGVGDMPAYQNALILNQIYYDDCLQTLIEAIEALLDDGLGLPEVEGHVYGTELDIDALLRMDESTLTEVVTKQTGAGIRKIDEARLRFNLGPVDGGDTTYLQQQNYSLSALAKRDAGPDPFGSAVQPTPEPTPQPTEPVKALLLEMQESHAAMGAEVKTLLEMAVAAEEAKDQAMTDGARKMADALRSKFIEASVAP